MGPVTVVFDTNVVISAAGWDGKPARCIEEYGYTSVTNVIVSFAILREIYETLQYDQLPFTYRDQVKIPATFVVESDATVRWVDTDLSVVDEDHDDDKFFECAVEADADYLVSGNDHVVEVREFRGVDVVSPDGFLAEME